jgi:hypothetical protein
MAVCCLACSVQLLTQQADSPLPTGRPYYDGSTIIPPQSARSWPPTPRATTPPPETYSPLYGASHLSSFASAPNDFDMNQPILFDENSLSNPLYHVATNLSEQTLSSTPTLADENPYRNYPQISFQGCVWPNGIANVEGSNPEWTHRLPSIADAAEAKVDMTASTRSAGDRSSPIPSPSLVKNTTDACPEVGKPALTVPARQPARRWSNKEYNYPGFLWPCSADDVPVKGQRPTLSNNRSAAGKGQRG